MEHANLSTAPLFLPWPLATTDEIAFFNAVDGICASKGVILFNPNQIVKKYCKLVEIWLPGCYQRKEKWKKLLGMGWV